MRISFRQGIVRYPVSGSQQDFLEVSGTYVNLNAANGRIEVTFGHRGTNYLLVENQTVSQAWGPLTTNGDHWLYWDIDLDTGARTFGTTAVEPVFQSSQPTNVAGLHWYDTINNIHYVGDGTTFSEVVRVFAAKITVSGNVPIENTAASLSAGLNGLAFAGSQIGSNISNYAGRIVFDNLGNVVTRENGELFTSEDQFFLDGSQVNSVRLESNVNYAKASEALGAFTAVKYNSSGLLEPAVYDDTDNNVIALVTESAGGNDVVANVLQGVVRNPSWTWSTIGSKLWVSGATPGLLTETNPNTADPVTYPVNRVPVARVLSTTEIIFEQGLGGVGKTGATGAAGVTTGASWGTISGTLANQTDLQLELNGKADTSHTQAATTVTFSATGNISGANVQLAIAELDTEKLGYIGGTMTGKITLDGDPTANLHAATKQYVDTFLPLAGGTLTGLLTLSGDPSTALQAATKQYVDTFLPLGGGTLTGTLTLNGDPSTALEAATKQYVDSLIAAGDTLGELTDVTITSPTAGEILSFAGGSPAVWVNSIIPYDLAGQIVGLPDAGATVFRFIAVRAFTIPQTGHQSMADVASSASAVFNVNVNDVTQLTIDFATSDTGTFAVAGSPAADISIVAGDVITIVAPAIQDATLSDIEIALQGYI